MHVQSYSPSLMQYVVKEPFRVVRRSLIACEFDVFCEKEHLLCPQIFENICC